MTSRRLLHLYKAYYPTLGGIENHIRVLAEAQAAAGDEVQVLVAGPAGDESLNGVRVRRFPAPVTAASTPLSPGLWRAVADARVDLVHVHTPYPLGEMAQWRFGSRPYVVTYHAEPTRPVQRLILRAYAPLFGRYLRDAARIIVTSPRYAEHSPFLPAWADKLRVVPLGQDPGRFTPGPPKAQRPFTLLFAGLLRHYKGLSVLLRALPLLATDARLIVIGDGPERKRLVTESRRLGVADQITWRGRVSDADLANAYQQADVFVLPALNRAEAFGTVLVEAMLSGLPCVTTEVDSGTSWVVADGQTGLVVPPRSARALASALLRLQTDPELRARLGRAGRQRALDHFTTDAMLAGLRAVYDEVL
jgi:rhamnosyl/mannosyltransferase